MTHSILPTQTNFIDKEHEAIFQKLETELHDNIELQAKHDAQSGKPVINQEFKILALNPIENSIQGALHFNSNRHQPISGMVTANSIRVEAEKKIASLNAEIKNDEVSLLRLTNEQAALKPNNHRKIARKIVFIGACIIALVEGIFAFQSLRQGGFPKTSGVIAAIGIAVGIGFGIHFIASWINNAKTKWRKALIGSSTLLVSFAGFYGLGILRSQAYGNTYSVDPHVGHAITYIASAVKICIISFFLFLIAFIASVMYQQTKEEQVHEDTFKKIEKEKQNTFQRIAENKRKKDFIQKETAENIAVALSRYEFALSMENRLINLARKTTEVYKNSNLRNRTDGIIPSFYSEVPPFQFKLFFDTLKSNNP